MRAKGIGPESPSKVVEAAMIHAERRRIALELEAKGFNATMIARIMMLSPNQVREHLKKEN